MFLYPAPIFLKIGAGFFNEGSFKMNLATGSLMLLGFVLLVAGIVSKLMGMALLAPFFNTSVGCFMAANACLLLVLVVDKFQKS